MTVPAILCVDDEPLLLLALKQELKSHFHDRYLYETAGSAEEGLKVMAELEEARVRVILVLSDWQMPGMRGDDFLLRVRRSLSTVKTVLITGHASPEALAKMGELGLVDRVVLKPWRPEVLVETIQDLVGP